MDLKTVAEQYQRENRDAATVQEMAKGALAKAYNNLGASLRAQRKLSDAIAAYTKATELDRKHELAFLNLGQCLMDRQKWSEASEALRKAIDNSPKRSLAHAALARAHYWQGSFAEAAACVRRAIELRGPDDPPLNLYQVHLQDCEIMVALEKRLSQVLEGKDKAGAGELLELARMCVKFKKQYQSGARLYQEAFASDPKLSADQQIMNQAVRAAALAAAGKLKDEQKAAFRQQARSWLESALSRHAASVKSDRLDGCLLAAQQLSYWRKASSLAGIRDAKELERLPEEERKAWQKLWADVSLVLQDAERRFSETRVNSRLLAEEENKVHQVELKAGRTYLLDLESADFNTLLKLQDEKGKLMARSELVGEESTSSRLVFTPKTDGVYRLVVSSDWVGETGGYTLRLREVVK
jgi:tetratricopeptide (TPR) repeat protein